MAEELTGLLDPARTAVVVVDVQNDFCHEASVYASKRTNLETVQAAVARMETFIAEARRAGASVIFVKAVVTPDADSEASGDALAGPDPARKICEAGSWGGEFYRLAPQEGDLIISKSKASAFIRTGLEEQLIARGISTLLMTGVSTNVCVESTTRDGHMLDFTTILVPDCCGAYKPHLHEATIENVRDRFGRVAEAAEVVACWAVVPAGGGR